MYKHQKKVFRFPILIFLITSLISSATYSMEKLHEYTEKNGTLTEDSTQHDESTNKPNITKPQVLNGRLYFQNSQELNEFFKQYADSNDHALFNVFEDNYEESFFSLRPPITEANEEYVFNKLNSNYSGKMDWSADAINATEEVIGHDTFAAMLNIDGEIQVGDHVYKYTDVGMFAVSDAKYAQLNNYLDHIGISRSLLNPSDSVIRQQFLNENQSAAKSAPVKQGDVIFYGA